ncbi:hypothetical protein GCG54_00012462 [Colletotrichum gloeosporioides]|uniref:TPR domain-containing protein n=1 Tax=Colletotrichum gloeosporioides TaxID=474922 RepID=A0A8H4CDV8_COLGL|nr:uncharacterized protein GCG54_00012462 [Colletotrichum gloeosporioides]KAF3802215.1 hypothetical protein GCG54_00012462 [Colletotrichum gloeosporioides]
MSDERYSDAMRAFGLCSHGSMLELKSRRYQDPNPQLSMETLQEAMKFGREALSIVPPHAENVPMLISTVSSWMRTMAKLTQDVKWTEEGIELLNRGLELNKGYTIDNSDLFASFSCLWEIQYGVLCGSTSDGKHIDILQRAIETGQKALSNTKPDSSIIGERDERILHPESRPKIKELFIEAARTETATPLVWIPSALQAGLIHWEYGELAQANDIFQNAIGLLTESNIQAASAEDLQQTLREIPNLGSLATSALSAPLEAANCILAGLAMNSRNDVSELERRYPEYANAYIDLRTRVAHASRQSQSAANYQKDTALQQSLIREMASMKEEIRHLEGFEKFQLPLSAIQMMQLATDGPIVTINVSELRSDAIIVTEEGVQSLHLTPAALQSHALVSNSRWNPARDIRRPPISPNVSTEAGLRWLWEVAVRPFLDGTKLTSSGRLWLITSGLAGRVPFHAADNYAGGPEEIAPSRVTSSYISSLKALKYG